MAHERKKENAGQRPTVIDLFCGCGGMSWGLKKSGFQIVAGIDNNRTALETYKKNFPEAKALDYDLSSSIEKLRDDLGFRSGELDVLVGGPPCQGFSKNVPRSGRFLEDAKNLLVRSFMEAIQVFHPKAVVMENVAEMANAFDGSFRDELLAQLNRLGYEADYEVHNAAEFGVPQRRRRVLFLANRMDVPISFPAKQYKTNGNGTHKRPASEGITVWEVIGDLSPVLPPRGRPNTYSCDPFTDFQRLMRSNADDLTDHEERRLRPKQQARYNSLEPGQGIKELPPELRPKSGYSGAYGRLTKGMIAPTITRWVFHPGSGRFGHPCEKRIITIREAARLQSFSDDFGFIGGNQEKSWQIGNAVPPLLMMAVAPILKEFISGVAEPRSRLRATRQGAFPSHKDSW
jgi:DNA (cytosine-5)-methyltransferase 1